jgi:hypothetical protein
MSHCGDPNITQKVRQKNNARYIKLVKILLVVIKPLNSLPEAPLRIQIECGQLEINNCYNYIMTSKKLMTWFI